MGSKLHTRNEGNPHYRNEPTKNTTSKERARAQMRSVDFALSLVIFMILIVYLFLAASGTTNTTFYNNQQQSREMDTYNSTLQILEFAGTPHSWNHNLKEFPEVFGLTSIDLQENELISTGIELDVGKIARIDPILNNPDLTNLYPNLYVPYPIARNLIPKIDEEYHFSIEIIGIIEVNTNIELQGNELILNSVVKNHDTLLEDAKVWTYILDPQGNTLGYNESFTNTNGATSDIKMNLPNPGTYVIVTIAKKGVGYAYDYHIINYNSKRDLNVIVFTQPHTQSGMGEILQFLTINPESVSHQNDTLIVRNANATVINAGGSTEMVLLEGDNKFQYGVSPLRLEEPQIIVSRAQALLDNTIVYGVGITAIPLILSDNHHHPSYNTLDLDNELNIEVESINVMNKLVLVHGIPMIITIKMWKTINPQI